MKEFTVSLSLKWTEQDVIDYLFDKEEFPSDKEIEEWMIDELKEGAINVNDIKFKTKEVKKKQ